MSPKNKETRQRIILVGSVIATIVLMVVAYYWKPLKAQWQLSLASRAFGRRDYAQSHEHLEQAIRLRPKHAETHFRLARVYRHLDQPSRAAEHLMLAEKFGGNPQHTQREQWLMLAQRGRIRDAAPHLGELLATADEDQREICEAYVRGYLANLRLTEAEHLLTAWTKDFPEDAEAWFLKGSFHKITSNFSEAADAYRRATQLSPGRVETKLQLSEMLVELRQIEENHRVLEECLTVEPDNPAVLMAWARSQQSQGDLEAAQATLQKLLKFQPKDLDAQILSGQIALAQQSYEEAIRLLAGAIVERPHDTSARYALANAFMATGRTAEATPHLDFIAQAQASMSRLEDLVVKAVDEPQNAPLRFEIGSIAWRIGPADDAARWMLSVLELDPHHRGAHQVLAEYYKQIGQSDLALQHYQFAYPE